jgi:predicted RNase H-like nuclease (RuvC/YqgF family)
MSMSQDVSQWLAEIKALRQQLAVAQQEREQAYSSAANWQRLYETEAQQRRTDAAQAKQTINTLKLQIQQLKGNFPQGETGTETLPAIEAEVYQLKTSEALRQKLIQTLAERDRLIEALKTEQANHAQTRKGLTTALGDAIDMLKDKGGVEGKG